MNAMRESSSSRRSPHSKAPASASLSELPAEADRETELQWAAGMIQEAASNALLQSRLAIRMRQLERAAGGGEEPDGAGEAGASEDDE